MIEAVKRLIETAQKAAKHYKAMPFPNDRALGGMLKNDADNLQESIDEMLHNLPECQRQGMFGWRDCFDARKGCPEMHTRTFCDACKAREAIGLKKGV